MKIFEILTEAGLLQTIGKVAGAAKVMGQEFAKGSKKHQGTGILGGPNKYYDSEEDDSPSAGAAGISGIDNQLVSTAINQVLKGAPLATQKSRNQFATIFNKQILIPNQTKDWNSHWLAAAEKLSQGQMIDDPNQTKALQLFLKSLG